MLEKFLSKLGASTKITIGVSVSPNIGLEMITVDNSMGIVSKYACKPLEYNSSTREIADYEDFKNALKELFNELNIPTNSNIVLSIPNVYFGLMSLPLLLTDDAITNALISEVEQSYIFKRHEPVISWVDVPSKSSNENRPLVYTAIQQPVIEKIIEVCDEIGCSVVCIENSYASLLRTLDYLNIAQEQMKDDVSWNLMIIMQNNYSILSMNGKKILDYYEEPLALKSFIDDEIYNAIKTSAQLTLAGLPANYLFIVSETDLVSAEVLSMKLPFEGSVKFLECNKFIQNEIMPASLEILPNLAQLITPEAIGTAVYSQQNSPLKLNLLGQLSDDLIGSDTVESYPKINVGNLEIELTPKFIKKAILLVALILIIPAMAALLTINNYLLPKEKTDGQNLDTKITQINSEIKVLEDKNKGPAFDVFEKIMDIVALNKSKLVYYSALGVSTPPKLWINYYAVDSNGKVDIQGASSNVKSIYTFYKNLKLVINETDIQLKKLELASNSVDALIKNDIGMPKTYEFEISNMDDASLAAPMPTTDQAANQPGQPNQPAEQQGDQPSEPNKGRTPSSGLTPYSPGQPFFNLGSGQSDPNKPEDNVENRPNDDPDRALRDPRNQRPPRDPNLPNNLRKIEKF